MKQLINKIKTWFSRKTNPHTTDIFKRCDDLAKRYGTRCSYLSFGYIYYPYNDKTGFHAHIQTLKRSGESIYLDMNDIDVEKILATFELMLIKDYGKAGRLEGQQD